MYIHIKAEPPINQRFDLKEFAFPALGGGGVGGAPGSSETLPILNSVTNGFPIERRLFIVYEHINLLYLSFSY